MDLPYTAGMCVALLTHLNGHERACMKTANILGWVAVVLVTIASTFWAFWGIIEAFHEGWCKPHLWMRLLQVLAYLTPASVFCLFAVTGIRWPRIGATLCVLAGVVVAALIVIDQARFSIDIIVCITALPMVVGLLFLFGRPEPQRLAYFIALGLPLAMVLIFGIEPVFRVSTRFDDGNRGARVIEGKGVTLLWAPAGPGWSRDGNVTWSKAKDRVRFLSADGLSLASVPQDIWRLPNRSEIVGSLTRHNRNAGGVWDAEAKRATYEIKPDKESPLWDPLAPLIYLWTDEECDEKHAWIVVYHGGIYPKPKSLGSPSNGFRAVRDVPEE